MRARTVIERHLTSTLQAIHLYGSAVEGGLRPESDLDLLVTVASPPDEPLRQALLRELLMVSAPPGMNRTLRALEVTVIVHNEVVPWRYPPRRELQFGEWLRGEILQGIVKPAVVDIDLAILLKKARQASIALLGPAAEELFEPVPTQDFYQALSDSLSQWNARPDWAGDERNIVLTVARIWYSTVTAEIVPKDVAAAWLAKQLPAELQSIVLEARQAYLGHDSNSRLITDPEQVEAFILYAKAVITSLIGNQRNKPL